MSSYTKKKIDKTRAECLKKRKELGLSSRWGAIMGAAESISMCEKKLGDLEIQRDIEKKIDESTRLGTDISLLISEYLIK